MRCADCLAWICKRVTLYEDGSEIVNYAAPAGVGHCKVLDLDTKPEFGCVSFKAGDHVEVATKPGAPWNHWVYGPCPDSSGTGVNDLGACTRCAGTGKVRYYDDGYIGEEQVRLHPMELALRKREAKINAIAAAKAALEAAEKIDDVPLPEPSPRVNIKRNARDGILSQQGSL